MLAQTQLQTGGGSRLALTNKAVLAAHLRLHELKEAGKKYDWTGRIYGEPVGRPEQQIPKGKEWVNWLYMAGRGSGKALDTDTPIFTSKGWKAMGELVEGDKVFDENGEKCRVMKAHPVMENRPCYRVGFNDGSSIIADEQHLWMVCNKGYRDKNFHNRYIEGKHAKPKSHRVTPKIKTTHELAKDLFYKHGHLKWAVPVAKALQHGGKSMLPIPPYTFGIWLGDGSKRDPTITTMDSEVIKGIKKDGFILIDTGSDSSGKARSYRVRLPHEAFCDQSTANYYAMYLPRALKGMGVRNNKHIPEIYFHSAIEQRWELLRGLLDSDGWAKHGKSHFDNTNKRLFYGVVALIRSLGIKPIVWEGSIPKNPNHNRCYHLYFRTTHKKMKPFTVKRKVANCYVNSGQLRRHLYRFVSSIEPVKTRPVRCITVDSPSSLYLAGKDLIPTHNTRSAAEATRELVKQGYSLGGFIGATAGDVRDIMVEGISGIIAVCHDTDVDNKGRHMGKPIYQSSKRRVVWANGAQVALYSAEEPNRLRGPQHEFVWCDELAAWQYMRETWDMMRFGLRIGNRCICVVTTTPRPLKLMKELINDGHGETIITRGSTYDNKANLSKSFFQSVVSSYEGTSLGRQELYGDLLEQAEGALWNRKWFDTNRFIGDASQLPSMKALCISIDPAVTATEESDETGIIVTAIDEQDMGWVLEDRSGRHTPAKWAQIGINLYRKWNADYIVAEVNNGGDLVINNIRTLDTHKEIPIKKVVARKGKFLRAEPIANLYEQGRVRHFNQLSDLEDQQTGWQPLGKHPSPDRIDALVQGLTKLMIKRQMSKRLALPASRKLSSAFSGGKRL